MFQKLFELLFAPQGRFTACGMFTAPHIVATAFSILVVTIVFVHFSKRFNESAQIKLYRILAFAVTTCEVIKITHSFANGYTHLDAWMPISYCSLFIYSLWMAGFGKGLLKGAGEAFIAFGCPVAGLAFLIFPTTSLMNYPIWHFLSLYSLTFHTLMLLCGSFALYRIKFLTLKSYLSYVFFLLFFSAPAIILNCTKGSNLMNLREPYNIPIEFLQNLYRSSTITYTIVVLFAYIIIPILICFLTKKIKFFKTKSEL